MTAIHAIVLTLNEELHLARCLASIREICETITVIDSGSTDRTVEIANAYGAEVVTHPFVNYALQINFGIDHVAGRGNWLMRIDADEVLTPLSDFLLAKTLMQAPPETCGILVKRQIVFMGRTIRWGGMHPVWQLRIWREGRGRCETRWMDEHIVVTGTTVKSDAVVEDRNDHSIDWWTRKHNSYASREAIDLLNRKYALIPNGHQAPILTPQAARKRLVKEQVYARLPGPLRTSLYFLYRYIACLGFLDGKAGFYFHVLQGLWYRTLVDAKISDIETYADEKNISMVEAIRARTSIDIGRRQDMVLDSSTARADSPIGSK